MLLNNSHWRESSGGIHFYTSNICCCSIDLLQSHEANMWIALFLKYFWKHFTWKKTCHYKAAGCWHCEIPFEVWIKFVKSNPQLKNAWNCCWKFLNSCNFLKNISFKLQWLCLQSWSLFWIHIYMHFLSSKCTHLLSFKVHNLNLLIWLPIPTF